MCPVGRQPINFSSISRFATFNFNVQFKTESLNVHMGLACSVVFTVAATSGSTVVGLRERTAALGQNLKIGVV